MASRSSAGIGVGITITLLGVLSLALFITTIVFLSKYNAAQRQLTANVTEREEYIRGNEIQSDAIQRLRTEAKKDGNKSVVGYLNETLKQTMTTVSGTAGDSYAQLTEKLKGVPGAESNNLIGVVHARDTTIASLTTQLADANKTAETARADLNNEVDRVKQLNAAHQKTIDTMNGDINQYKAEVDRYRAAVDDAKKMMDQEIEKCREQAAQTASALNEKNRGLEAENLQLKDQLAKINQLNRPNILRPKSEMALVDGEVIGLNSGANSVTINRGAKDKVFLGMTFSVYGDAAAINPDPRTGDYPRGKATLEVINVGDTSSVCRITSETRGNPVVRGDVIANAIYDPSKVYTFLVYGNFDPSGAGVATPGGAEDIKAMIASWGGKTVDDLTGNVDFLVLGQRPQLPPKPGPDAPMAILTEYIRLDKLAQKYDHLLEQATSTSLPVLNENRLYTLIGRRGSR